MKDEFTHAVIGKAMQVHRELGPGLDEVFYHELLSKRLGQAGLQYESRPRGQLVHCGLVADTFEADLLFPDRVVAELKCLRGGFDPEHYVQLICYLKFWRVQTGLLLDFGKESLNFRRVNHRRRSRHRPDLRSPAGCALGPNHKLWQNKRGTPMGLHDLLRWPKDSGRTKIDLFTAKDI